MSLTLGSGTEFNLQWGGEGDRLEKTLEQHQKTSHAGHVPGAPGHADHSQAPAGGASCCSQGGRGAGETATPLALKDPVCGMTVTAESPHVLEHEGKPVYFCSAGCKAKFAADPAKYMKPAGGAAAAPSRRRARALRARSTPARCTRRCARTIPAPARSAAWRSSRRCRASKRARAPSWSTSAGASGGPCR